MARSGIGAVTIVEVADGTSPVLERSYTTTAGLLSEIGNPTTPGTDVTWTETSSPFTVPSTAFWVADRQTVNSVTSSWQISPVQAKDGGLPFVTYPITRKTPALPTLGDTQWIADAIDAVEAFTGRTYSTQKEFGYGTVVVITYNISGTITKLAGKYARSGSSDTWVAPGTLIDGDLIVDGTVAADKIQANAITTTKLSVDAISGKNITGGDIMVTIPTTGIITVDSGSGYYMHNDGRFVFGSGASQISWDGTSLAVAGSGGGGGGIDFEAFSSAKADYAMDDLVYHLGNLYACNATVCDGTSQVPGTHANWLTLVGGGQAATSERMVISRDAIRIFSDTDGDAGTAAVEVVTLGNLTTT